MLLKKNRKRAVVVLGFLFCFLFQLTVAFAAPSSDMSLEEAIKQQEILTAKLVTLKQQEKEMRQAKETEKQEKLAADVARLQQQIEEINKMISAADQQSVMAALQSVKEEQQRQQRAQEDIRTSLDSLQSQQQSVMSMLESMRNTQSFQSFQQPSYANNNGGASFSGNTQDAASAQRDAEMQFSYSPGGLYKIYCKPGYLTDIRFREGEKITFVGGGNTAQWVMDTSNTGSGSSSVPHLYVKPARADVATNIIVNTTNHSYQILLNTADWYNPIVSWAYSSEVQLMQKINAERDNAFFAEKNVGRGQPENLNFDYKVKTNKQDWAPTAVFDDGQKTYIKMPNSVRQGDAPVLFVKERGKKELSLVNYRVKDNYYVIDRLFDQAELRVSEKDSVQIKRN